MLMDGLHICLFGRIRVAHAPDAAEVKMPPTASALLAFLLLHRERCQSRDVLACLRWGDQPQEQARNALNTALWRLRRALEPDGTPRGTYLVTLPSGEIGFNWQSEPWVDLVIFETGAAQTLAVPPPRMTAAHAAELESVLPLYDGELLEGFYDDWALRERERMRSLYLDSLAHLMDYYELSDQYNAALAAGQKILAIDPLREEVHRHLMRIYLRNGQRALAIRQYHTCCAVLESELDLPPMDETEALYRQMAPGTRDMSERGPLPRSGARHATNAANQLTLTQAVQQLSLAMQTFEDSRLHLQQAMRLVTTVIESQNKNVSDP